MSSKQTNLLQVLSEQSLVNPEELLINTDAKLQLYSTLGITTTTRPSIEQLTSSDELQEPGCTVRMRCECAARVNVLAAVVPCVRVFVREGHFRIRLSV